MAKLIAIVVFSWLAALATLAIVAWLPGRASTQDVVSLCFWGGLVALTATLVYAPAMFTLRHRAQSVWTFMAASAVLAIVPVVLFAALLDSFSGLLSGVAALLLGTFAVFGVCFGAAFYWSYVRRPARQTRDGMKRA